MTEEKIEIYRQRYETFRHLDRLRWQMLQILVAVASATAVFLRLSSGPVGVWFLFWVGFALFILGQVMLRIGAGLRANAVVLKGAAEAIGDEGVPDTSNRWKSLAHWLALLTVALGVAFLGASVLKASA